MLIIARTTVAALLVGRFFVTVKWNLGFSGYADCIPDTLWDGSLLVIHRKNVVIVLRGIILILLCYLSRHSSACICVCGFL